MNSLFDKTHCNSNLSNYLCNVNSPVDDIFDFLITKLKIIIYNLTYESVKFK